MNYLLAHELFEYKDGDLYWRIDVAKNVKKGSKAGTSNRRYIQFRYLGKSYLLHRIVFLMHHNFLPDFIDHIDGNPFNNRIENLRQANKYENSYNSKILSHNTSGKKGICWNARKRKWVARCSVNGVRKLVGYFENIEDAEKNIKEFRKMNHKEFANDGGAK